MKADVATFCARIGADPLLVQAGGGNVSWKDGETLWVKASGVWLAQALERPIFLPVSRPELREAFARGDFEAATRGPARDGLRPSIETALHALMPHRVVVHVHAVEALIHLVRRDCAERLRDRLGDDPSWRSAPYCKPGPDLARAVAEILRDAPEVDTIFLQNHGVIVGADTAAEAESRLARLCARLRTLPRLDAETDPTGLPALEGLHPHDDVCVHVLARDPELFERIGDAWALYPDHVVFLGARPCRIDAGETPASDFAFVRGLGVYCKRPLTPSEAAYLRCYADVLRRVPHDAGLLSLTEDQIGELLNWDLEKFRIGLSEQAKA